MFSIIIPVYNSSDHLAQCLTALMSLKACEEKHEVIVVDDGSTDGSLEIARSFPIVVIPCKERGGAARARNTGARESVGDILLFLDADVVLPSDALVVAKEVFDSLPGLDGFNGIYANWTPVRGFLSKVKNLYLHYLCVNARPDYSAFWSAILFIKREPFMAVGGFDERMASVLEDVELGMRLAKRGIKFHIDARVPGVHLKEFSLRGLLKSDYSRSLALARLLLRKERDETSLYRQSIGPRGFLSAVTPAMALAGLILGLFFTPFLYLAAAGLILFLVSRAGMLRLFFSSGGIAFGIGAAGVLMIEHLAAQAAGGVALAEFLVGRRGR